MLEGTGFSGGISRRLKGQPGPSDIFRRVLVGVRRMPTRLAAEARLADAVLGGGVPTRGAPRGGVAGIYLDDHPPGAFSLGAQYVEEHPHPASRIDRLRPAMAATLVPGASSVPAAERVMLAIRSASCAIRSWSRASFRAVLCAKPSRWRRILRCTPATRSLALCLRGQAGGQTISPYRKCIRSNL